MTGSMLGQAIALAAQAHAGQLRKYTQEPYIVHPMEVMSYVSHVKHTEEMLCAAVLHDVVEDTDVKITQIYKQFGRKVHDLVWALTEQHTVGNRAARKAAEVVRWSRQEPEAMTIKLADLISNTASIVEHDPSFAKVYLAEKIDLLKVLGKGDPTLLKSARIQVGAALMKLGS